MSEVKHIIPVALAHVHWQHADALAPCVLQDLVRGVNTHRLAFDEARGAGFALVTLEPAACVGHRRESRGVTLWEAVSANPPDAFEGLLRVVEALATLEHAGARASRDAAPTGRSAFCGCGRSRCCRLSWPPARAGLSLGKA